MSSMYKRGYPMDMSLGSIAAGGTLGILIPPSVNMIIYGSLTDTSIGKLFIAGIVPGLLLTGCSMLYILIHALVTGSKMREEPVPMATRIALLKDLVPPAVVLLIVMGSLYGGLATTTESTALGVVTSLGFAWYSRKLSWALLQHRFAQTAKTSGMILLIITAAFNLGLAISLTGVAEAMTSWVTSFGFSAMQMLLVLIVFYFLLGMFMDVLSMLVATIPITFPIITHLGIDPVWFGIFIVLMCELGMITPPVGMNLFIVLGIRPDTGGIRDAMVGAVPYVVILLLFTLMLIVWPGIATRLPHKM